MPRLHLTVPADPTSLRVLRVTVAAAACDVIEEMDGLDAVRLAVDELATVAIAAAVRGSDLDVDVCTDGNVVDVVGRAPAGGEGPELTSVGASLITFAAESFHLHADDDAVVFRARFGNRRH